MVDSKLVEDGGLEIVDVNRIRRDVVSEIVRFAIGEPGFDPASGQPYCETSRVMIATIVGRGELSL